MKKQKKILISIIIFITILLINYKVFASDYSDGEIVFSQEYLEYLELSDKENVIPPRAYDILENKSVVTNPLRLVRMLRSSLEERYSLKDIIPENMIIKNQSSTSTCWAFASLASLETNLALKDYKNGITTPIIYDFSERHMDYATTRVFLDGKINEFGFNRVPGDVAVGGVATAYLTNGLGAVLEEDMLFESNLDLIDISEIQNKSVKTQVNDIITFTSTSVTEDNTEIIKQMKEHIKNYGAITAQVHSANYYSGSPIYNAETSAAYCNSTSYKIDHSVAIVGWDDNFAKENFVKENRPTNNGAWIVKNSWGTSTGDKGYVYISYEDVNIYKNLTGIESAQTELNYENIYQYDEFGGFLKYKSNGSSKLYLATEFDKKTTGKEYITHISVHAPETYICKVYVNPNGTSKLMKDLQQVELKTGETETINAGYHTIEFLNPVKINNDQFVIVLEVQGTQENYVTMMIEMNYGEFYTDSKYANAANHDYDNVTIADQKCFIAKEEEVVANEWRVTSKMNETSNGKLPNFDTTIKAFTTSDILENITVKTQPTKTKYVEGQDFNKEGMVVTANYANGNSIEINDFIIIDGENLALNQTNITIAYKGFVTTQSIEVEKNTIESIEIKMPPTKKEYWAGDDFDATGMIVEAVYKDGTRIGITDYTIENSQTLKNDQTTVTIKYQEKTVTQPIIVMANNVQKIEITKEPEKVDYVVGQNFDTTGMVIEAYYANGTSKEVLGYKIQNGKKLSIDQTTVTIEYEGVTVKQPITVVEKVVTKITVKTMPNKTEYIQTREDLDLTGGIIEIFYNDNTNEEMIMTSEEILVTGFDKEKAGKQTITIIYQDQTAQIDIQVKELPKPQNSNFDKIKGNVTRIRAYSYTDKNKKEYTILNIKLDNMIKANENETMKYYYYLSINPNEENIANWVEMTELQQEKNNLSFEINTLDIANYEELVSAGKIYLYVKEVAIRNSMKSEKITSSVAIDAENIVVEEFVDDEKKTNLELIPSKKEDNTKAPGTIPKAGEDILMIVLTIVIIAIGKISYSKYKDIQIK